VRFFSAIACALLACAAAASITYAIAADQDDPIMIDPKKLLSQKELIP
jgi:hypothetical protein